MGKRDKKTDITKVSVVKKLSGVLKDVVPVDTNMKTIKDDYLKSKYKL